MIIRTIRLHFPIWVSAFLVLPLLTEQPVLAQQSTGPMDPEEYYALAQSVDFAAHRINLDRFMDLRAEGALVFDLRNVEDFAQSHVEGALHLGATEITAVRLAELTPDKNQTILIYCSNSLFPTRRISLTDIALPQFVALGYTNVFSLGLEFPVGNEIRRLPMISK